MFSWTFSNQKTRSSTWYITGAIVMMTLLIYGIFSGMFFMSVAVVLFVGVFLLIENNNSPNTEIKIDERTIFINENSYIFGDFESFSIIDVGNGATLLRFHPKKTMATRIEIPVPADINGAQLREFLLAILPENTQSTFSGTDAIAHLTKI